MDQCQNINIHYCDPQVHVGFKCGTESRYCQDTRRVHGTLKKKNTSKIHNQPCKGTFEFWPLTSSPKDNCKIHMQDKIFLTLHCLSRSCLKAKFSANSNILTRLSHDRTRLYLSCDTIWLMSYLCHRSSWSTLQISISSSYKLIITPKIHTCTEY